MTPLATDGEHMTSASLKAAISRCDFSERKATVIGYGSMGKHHVQGLEALGIQRIRVCSRSQNSLDQLKDNADVETLSGGFRQLDCNPEPGELGIVSTPRADLAPAARHLARLGFRHILIEKPVSLWSTEVRGLAKDLESQGVDAVCAYNRVAYPSLIEARAAARAEGGITSCRYTFTEMIKDDWPERFSPEEMARLGVSNSLHVMSMAHGLIGMPSSWTGHRSGGLSWHPTGAVFVGSGISEEGIPFAYHADWGSKGRWSVEFHTRESAYLLCPLEGLFQKTSATGRWDEVQLASYAPSVKAGIVEQIAAMLTPEIRGIVPLVALEQAAAYTGYGEEIFGYERSRETVRVASR